MGERNLSRERGTRTGVAGNGSDSLLCDESVGIL